MAGPVYTFGSGEMWIVPLSDINGNNIAIPTPQRLGAMQEMSLTFNFPQKELYGTNYFPLAVGRGAAKLSLKAKFAQWNMGLINNAFFGEPSQPTTGGAVNQIQIAHDEPHSVPAVSTYIVTVTNIPGWVDLGVRYASGANAGNYFTAAASPVLGTYSAAAGVYTFAAADANAAILIDYAYALTASTNQSIVIAQHLLGAANFLTIYGTSIYGTSAVNFRMNKVVATSWDPATKLEDFAMMSMDFGVLSDGAGNVGIITGPGF